MAICTACGYDSRAKVTDTWSYTVESYTPSLNKIGVNDKNNPAYRNWKKNWVRLFGPWLDSLPAANKKRRLTIVRHYGKGKRAFDRINFAAGQKPLLDVVVIHGGLYDDSELWCCDVYRQEPSPDGIDRVTVTLEELA